MKEIGISLVFVLISGSAHAGAVSTFSSGAEAWTSAGFQDTGFPVFPTPITNSNVNFNATGGNSGGYISKSDPDTNWQYFSAPAAFLGNQSVSIGLSLTFDELILNTAGQTALSPQGPFVALSSGTTTLVYGGGNVSVPLAGSGWNSINVPLVASSWRVGTPSGAVATSAQFGAVMSNLTGLYILADFWRGFDATGETLGLDNVNLPAVPEPTSAFMLIVGLAALNGLKRFRKSLGVSCTPDFGAMPRGLIQR